MVFGIVLGVVGAIMAWAVTTNAEGFSINTAGLILFGVGVLTFLIGLLLILLGNRSSTVRRTEGADGRTFEFQEEQHRSI
jgi:hypothetical protein